MFPAHQCLSSIWPFRLYIEFRLQVYPELLLCKSFIRLCQDFLLLKQFFSHAVIIIGRIDLVLILQRIGSQRCTQVDCLRRQHIVFNDIDPDRRFNDKFSRIISENLYQLFRQTITFIRLILHADSEDIRFNVSICTQRIFLHAFIYISGHIAQQFISALFAFKCINHPKALDIHSDKCKSISPASAQHCLRFFKKISSVIQIGYCIMLCQMTDFLQIGNFTSGNGVLKSGHKNRHLIRL